MGQWDKLFRLLEKHQNHSARTWLNPKFIFSNFFVVRNKTGAQRGWLIQNLTVRSATRTQILWLSGQRFSSILVINQKWDHFLHKDYALRTHLSGTGSWQKCKVLVPSKGSIISTQRIHGGQLLQKKPKLYPDVDAKWCGPDCLGQATATTVVPSLHTISRMPTQYIKPSAHYCPSHLESPFSARGSCTWNTLKEKKQCSLRWGHPPSHSRIT